MKKLILNFQHKLFDKLLFTVIVLFCCLGYAQQTKIITGLVIENETNQPLPGVTVLVKNTNLGTTTDFDGNFSIKIPLDNELLVFSYIGFLSKEVSLAGKLNIQVSMVQDIASLDEVVVIGYGTTRKESLTGSVGTVKGESLENIPSSRVDQILQGRVSGVNIIQVDGSPGAPSLTRIRGGNSIQGNNDPLYVIDGFIVGSDFNLNAINTNDIQSIDVLKDATAIAIYGTRGANGVILITTKNGNGVAPGKPLVSFNMYSGIQHLMNEIDFLNGPQQALYSNEDSEYRNSSLPFPDPTNVPNVDWLNEITRSAIISNVDASVSGQSLDQKVNYYISGNYFNQDGIIKNSGIERYNFRTNLKVELSDRVNFGVNLNISRLRKENNKVNFSAILNTAGLPTRAIYDVDGNYTAVNPVSGNITRNPVADIALKIDHNIEANIFGSAYLEFEPIKNLFIKSSFGPKMNYVKINEYNPGILPENEIVQQGGDGRVRSGSSLDLLNENTVSYNTDFGANHHLDLLAGFTWQKYNEESNLSQGFGFPNDVLEYNNLSNGSDPTRNVIGSDWDSFQLVSWLGRANYQFKNKYILTLVGRMDGSSRFSSSNNPYAFFPSGAVAWRLDQEPFIKNLNVFDVLKLRTSYGLAGSQAIKSFRSLALLNNASAFFNGTEQYGVQNGRPYNNNLKWETTSQFDLGLETAFFNRRLIFEADYYNKRTQDLLLEVQIPRQTGFESKLQNRGSIRNQGLEFKLSTINVSKPEFNWSTVLTLSGNRTTVLDLGGVDFIDVVSPTNGGPGGRLMVGESVPVFVGVEYLGTWKTQEDIDNSGQTAQNVGGPRFKDTNGDGDVNILDFEVLGSPEPDFFGGIQNSFTYKNLTLDIFIQGSYGNEIYNSLTQSAYFGRPESNKYKETLNRWTPENQNSDIPRAGTVATLAAVYSNTKMIEDGSYLRLKHLQLTYDLPVKTMGLNSFKKLSLYFSGTNLFLISDFRLFDPEVSAYGRDNIANGFSEGEYPYARTFTLGLKASL